MKKSLLMMSVAATILASCTQNEVLNVADSRAIGFDAFVGKSTRVTEDVTLDKLQSFELYGWRGDDKIFDKQVVTNNNGTCTYTPIQYWEANYVYNFEAIAPAHDETKVNFTAAKDGGSITFTNDGTTDLLYAKAVEKTMGETIDEDPGAIGLEFKHLLSRVKFTFTNGFPTNAAAKITVTDVKISNAYASASITPKNDGNWSNHGSNNKEITFPSSAIANITGQASAATEHMYLIPHNSPSYSLAFKVTLDQNGVTSIYDHTATITTSMTRGLSYNFTAKLDALNIDPETQLYPIVFTATEDEWENFPSEGTDVTLD